MAYPENPDTLVLRNKYYPRGLREIDVWNHYQRYKREIIKEVFNRDVMFFVFVDLNKPVVRRRGAKGSTIRLNSSNYDQVITGRSVSLHAAMKSIETFGIIDIDIDPRDGIRWARKATMDTYNLVMDKMPFISTAQIRYTGKHSFHIICNLGRRAKIDSIKFLLQKFLRESDLARVYTVSGKRTMGVPNLDLAPNKVKGNYIVLNALSVWGLRSMEVPYNRLSTFDPLQARLK